MSSQHNRIERSARAGEYRHLAEEGNEKRLKAALIRNTIRSLITIEPPDFIEEPDQLLALGDLSEGPRVHGLIQDGGALDDAQRFQLLSDDLQVHPALFFIVALADAAMPLSPVQAG